MKQVNESIAKINRWNLKNFAKQSEDYVIREKVFTIQISEVGSFTLLCTPTNLDELAFGFAFTEGLIDDKDNVISISDYDSQESTLLLKIRKPKRIKNKRNLIVTSGCGYCGKHDIESTIFSIPVLKNSFKFDSRQIELLEKNIRKKQDMFNATGGSHVAAIFNSDGEIISMREDVGRHNALDKAIGYCLINEFSTSEMGVFFSSRISFEMVTKAARAGIELIMGVSAPTDLAIKVANYWNITLCGFVRHGEANVYTAQERVCVTTD